MDNTNVRAAERAVYLAPAKAAGFRAAGYFLDIRPREALRRISADENGNLDMSPWVPAGTAVEPAP